MLLVDANNKYIGTHSRALQFQVAKIQQTADQLSAQLDKQLRWLERSVAAFDEGFEDEAGRLAVVVRVLVHDTRSSHSLLGQLGHKNVQFFDGALPPTAGNLSSYGGLVQIVVGGSKGGRFLPVLDDAPCKRGFVSFDDWWTMAVFTRPSGAPLSRREIILTAANQDGGAHVDPALDEDYRALQNGDYLGWESVDQHGVRKMDGAEKAAIRQIAHEILRTLNPDMPMQTPDPGDAGLIAMGMGLNEGSFPQIPGLPLFPINDKPHKVGRNAPCPCGSGRKFKRCHGPYLAP
ncbi:MAG: SEC-C domain-containing protein [Brucellaceae bacterium]|nr:SEC-C domain-containing protein [Brucellaceae bacterium]